MTSGAQILINEIQASNNLTIADEDGSHEDWIELFNTLPDTLDLSFYGISDDPSRPFRWSFPEGTTIPPSGHLLIWASGKDRRDPTLPLHTSFSLAQDGEPVLLTDFQGNRIDSVGPRRIPSDISYGRYPDGGPQWYFYSDPTPGSENIGPRWDSQAPNPVFSHEGGFYNVSFFLRVYTERPASIHYSLDGSEPTTDHPVWNGPLPVYRKESEPGLLSYIPTNPQEPQRSHIWREPRVPPFLATTIRARAFIDGGMPSKTITHTFFVHEADSDTLKTYPDSEISTRFYPLPVISIVTDSLHLFDHDTGIYLPGKRADNIEFRPPWGQPSANYFATGAAWERPASMEFFDPVRGRVFQQDIGIRIHGGASRAMPMKSLRLYARSEYGQPRFVFPFFDHPDSHPDYHSLNGHNIPIDHSFNRLILRNSGQDFYRYSTMFRDALIQGLVRNFNMDTQSYRPVIHFINGEYWGLINIRERYDKHYLARTYGIDPERIDYLSGLMLVNEGSSFHFRTYRNYISDHDLAIDEHYEHIKTLLDIDNFIDYNITNIYSVNLDWPGNNRDYFRYQVPFDPDAPPGKDGRWRYMLFDTDFGFIHRYSVDQAEYDMLSVATGASSSVAPNPAWSTMELSNLLKNKSFKDTFIDRFTNYLNSVFSPAHVHRHIDHYETILEPVIEDHIQRWAHPYRVSDWYYFISNTKDFAAKRPYFVRNHLKDYFDLGDTLSITLDYIGPESSGYLTINTMDVTGHTDGISNNPYPWTGIYFANRPIEIKASPRPGYQFAGWKEFPDHNSPVLDLTPEQDSQVTAIFEKEGTATFDPLPHSVADGSFYFDYWPADAPAGTYPDHMTFRLMDRPHPEQNAWVAEKADMPYDKTSGTRINGLGSGGLSLINSDSSSAHYTNRLGAVILGLDTRHMESIAVTWKARTIQPNSRRYALRLDYRIGNEGLFQPVLDHRNLPIIYKSATEPGHSATIGPHSLSSETSNKPYVQLLWRYYDIDESLDKNQKNPPMLGLNHIQVTARPTSAEEEPVAAAWSLDPNYPNPFNNRTVIPYQLAQSGEVSFNVYSIDGRLVLNHDPGFMQAGRHSFSLNMDGFASGIYVIVMRTSTAKGQQAKTKTRRITLIQ